MYITQEPRVAAPHTLSPEAFRSIFQSNAPHGPRKISIYVYRIIKAMVLDRLFVYDASNILYSLTHLFQAFAHPIYYLF